jgi:hypothetical protein
MKILITDKSGRGILKPTRGEVNFLPGHPLLSTESTRKKSKELLDRQLARPNPDTQLVSSLMAHLFSTRRSWVSSSKFTIHEILKEWPALTMKNEVCYISTADNISRVQMILFLMILQLLAEMETMIVAHPLSSLQARLALYLGNIKLKIQHPNHKIRIPQRKRARTNNTASMLVLDSTDDVLRTMHLIFHEELPLVHVSFVLLLFASLNFAFFN